RVARPLGRLVRAGHGDVRVPRRPVGCLGHERGDPGYVSAVDLSHEVGLRRAGRGPVGGRPAEQAAVEGGGGLRVALFCVHPARDSGRVLAALRHDLLLSSSSAVATLSAIAVSSGPQCAACCALSTEPRSPGTAGRFGSYRAWSGGHGSVWRGGQGGAAGVSPLLSASV